MANKKSIDAKAYINSKLHDMREQFKWTDENLKWVDENLLKVINENLKWVDENLKETLKKALIEAFRKDVASSEYQENLKIVREDSNIIREYLKRKKWGAITPKEFEDGKTEFYGQNMNLKFKNINFEWLSKRNKIKYIFDKYWGGDKALWLILDMAYIKEHGGYWDSEIRGRLFEGIFSFNNLSLSSAKRLMKFIPFSNILFLYPIYFKDSVYNNDEIIEFISKEIRGYNLNIKSLSNKMTTNNKKKMISSILHYHWTKWAERLLKDKGLILWEDIDSFDYKISQIVEYLDEESLSNTLWNPGYYLKNNYYPKENYHDYIHEKKIADALINAWKIWALRKNINNFIYLSDIEKAQIMDNSEEEIKLKNEQYNKDLEVLNKLWEELWFEELIAKEKQEETIQEEDWENVEEVEIENTQEETDKKNKRFNLFKKNKKK